MRCDLQATFDAAQNDENEKAEALHPGEVVSAQDLVRSEVVVVDVFVRFEDQRLDVLFEGRRTSFVLGVLRSGGSSIVEVVEDCDEGLIGRVRRELFEMCTAIIIMMKVVNKVCKCEIVVL